MPVKFNSFFNSVEGNEGDRCHYPVRLDTYGCGCQHNCGYCYARSLLAFRGLWNPQLPATADIKKIRQLIETKLKFRTDRRYVRCHGAFGRMLKELTMDKFSDLLKVRTTTEAYKLVSSWYYFGRYAAYLFLEVWINVCSPGWTDDLRPGWEPGENYTKGAQILAGSNDRSALDAFLDRVRKDTGDNVFAIETSLCAVAKFEKGTRYDGYYTERMLSDANGTRWHHLIYSLVS